MGVLHSVLITMYYIGDRGVWAGGRVHMYSVAMLQCTCTCIA